MNQEIDDCHVKMIDRSVTARSSANALLAVSRFKPDIPSYIRKELECGPMPNVTAALPNTGGALCSTPQSLADAQYWSAVQ